MRLLLTSLAIIAIPCLAVDVDLPTFGSNQFCPYFTAASGTPIRMTCGVAHHFVDNDKVHIEGVYGNTAANGTFYIDVITATTFDLYTTSGPTGPVASNGTWGFGDGTTNSYPGGVQFAGKVTGVTVKPTHPRLMVDPDGNLILFAASIGNGLLNSIIQSGTPANTAQATYTRAHGLAIGMKICVYSAIDPDLNCALSTSSYTITAVPSPTQIQWVTTNVTNATYANPELTISAWAQGGNPYWVSVNSGKAATITVSTTAYPLSNFHMNEALKLGIICHVNRADTSACAAAKVHVLRPEVMGSNFGCDTSEVSQGALCNDGKGDYIGMYLKTYAYLYDLMEWQLTAGEKTTIADKLFNDHLDSCTPLSRITLSGTMSAPFPTVPNGGNYGASVSTLTGAGGTAFTTEMQVGDALIPVAGIATSYFDGNEDGNGYSMVTGITNNSTATITGHCVTGSADRSCGSIIPTAYAVIHPWSTGNCGAIWFTKHHMGTLFGQPNWHQARGGTTLYGVSSANNMVITRMDGLMQAGTALAEISPKARNAVTAYAGYFAAVTWPMVQGWWSGMDMQGSSYSYTRGRQQLVGIARVLKYAYTGGPDITTDPYFNEAGSLQRFMKDPGYNGTTNTRGAWGWGADGDGNREFLNPNSQGYPLSWAANIAMNPTDPEVAKTTYFLRNMPTAAARLAGSMFFLTDPTATATDYTTGPTQRMWVNVSRAACAVTGYVFCAPANSGYGAVVSRKSWTGTADSIVGMEFGSHVNDHSVARTGMYVINRGGVLMMCYDLIHGLAGGGPNYPDRSNEMVPTGLTYNDGEYAYTHGIQTGRWNYVVAERWRGGLASREGNADNKVAYWRVDMKNAWVSGVTTATRDMAHLKAAGKQEYVIVFDHMVTATGRRIDGYHHWYQNGQGGEGTTTCPSGDTTCTNVNTNRVVDSASTGGTFALSSKILAPSGSNVFLDVGATFPAGYTVPAAGNGYTARLDICAGSGSCSTSGTSLEYAIVHKFGTAITVTESNPTNFHALELTDWVVVKARGTSTYAAIPAVTTTATTSYLGIGLDPGTYDVKLGGSTVGGCAGMPVIAGDNTILCDTVGAGSITVVPASGGGGGGTGAAVTGKATMTGAGKLQ